MKTFSETDGYKPPVGCNQSASQAFGLARNQPRQGRKRIAQHVEPVRARLLRTHWLVNGDSTLHYLYRTGTLPGKGFLSVTPPGFMSPNRMFPRVPLRFTLG